MVTGVPTVSLPMVCKIRFYDTTIDNNIDDIIYGHDDLRYKEYREVLWIIYIIISKIYKRQKSANMIRVINVRHFDVSCSQYLRVEPGQIKKDLTHPYVTDNPENVIKSIEIHDNPYKASHSTHAIIICTEWDEFVNLDYEEIYKHMIKPAFIFDGRKILNHKTLATIGFQIHTIGKR